MRIERYIRIQSDDPVKAPLSVTLLSDDLALMAGAATRYAYAIDLGTGQVEILTLHDATALCDALVQVLETQSQPQAQRQTQG